MIVRLELEVLRHQGQVSSSGSLSVLKLQGMRWKADTWA